MSGSLVTGRWRIASDYSVALRLLGWRWTKKRWSELKKVERDIRKRHYRPLLSVARLTHRTVGSEEIVGIQDAALAHTSAVRIVVGHVEAADTADDCTLELEGTVLYSHCHTAVAAGRRQPYDFDTLQVKYRSDRAVEELYLEVHHSWL